MAFRVSDRYSTSLAEATGANDLQITVASVTGFPALEADDTSEVSILDPATGAVVDRIVTGVAGNVLTLEQAVGHQFPARLHRGHPSDRAGTPATHS